MNQVQGDRSLSSSSLLAAAGSCLQSPSSDSLLAAAGSHLQSPSSDSLLAAAGSCVQKSFRIYVDGHCSRHRVQAFQRAGWAVVVIDDNDLEVGRAWGAVPLPWPQTPYLAEWWAFLAAVQLARGTSTVITDCKGVMTVWGQPWATKTSPRCRAAGFCRFASSFDSMQSIHDVRHMNSHRDLSSATSLQDRSDIIHNGIVDQLADEGGQLHGLEGKELLKQSRSIHSATSFCAGIARVLASSFNQVDTSKSQKIRSSRPTKMSALLVQHEWVRSGRVYRCKQCSFVSFKSIESDCLGRVRIGTPGFGPRHIVIPVWSGGERFYFCRLCGAHGAWRFMNLHKPCAQQPSTSKAKSQLKTLLEGRHPRTNDPLCFYRRGQGSFHNKAERSSETVRATLVPAAKALSATERMEALRERIRLKSQQALGA